MAYAALKSQSWTLDQLETNAEQTYYVRRSFESNNNSNNNENPFSRFPTLIFALMKRMMRSSQNKYFIIDIVECIRFFYVFEFFFCFSSIHLVMRINVSAFGGGVWLEVVSGCKRWHFDKTWIERLNCVCEPQRANKCLESNRIFTSHAFTRKFWSWQTYLIWFLLESIQKCIEVE